jgi:CRISPR/Cas system-associated protein Cas10 (large subunit of type III CRISPR-Cas system)
VSVLQPAELQDMSLNRIELHFYKNHVISGNRGHWKVLGSDGKTVLDRFHTLREARQYVDLCKKDDDKCSQT